jgi:hypothetical protein
VSVIRFSAGDIAKSRTTVAIPDVISPRRRVTLGTIPHFGEAAADRPVTDLLCQLDQLDFSVAVRGPQHRELDPELPTTENAPAGSRGEFWGYYREERYVSLYMWIRGR